ncbi:cytochrome c biogenesis protein CcsA [Actimicrobium sp. CCC2.4]|uniref:cytochrome C assembly family protein n=1 Tax=Actimicrobium sp. CCC2.4 TaxID=3048606 RepID=UPI002AC9A1F8|nr:cytochrome c biogenesis protein CcsA [Actimicrobium sp. CCC2.4]MEB0134486.1 cytochrome c biogenesis protein CcsA [Actimicrobium sp. CCC2.4]WPX33119.1 cytochrome c biogenesis protein CcsA [Actimicrobium sp. CCC2.4]
MQNYSFIAAALLYASCAFLPTRWRLPISGGVALAWTLHGLGLWSDVVVQDSLRLGFAQMLSAALWISVAVYWVENRNMALDSMRVLMLPVAAVAVLLPIVFPGNVVALDGKTALFPWHVAVAMLAYSTLTTAAFHAVLMAVQESYLHARRGPLSERKGGWYASAIAHLPALLTMEKMLFRLIAIGFGLLTLTVLSGLLFSEQLFGKALTWDHKTIFTLLSWVLFGVLLAGRHWRGWRGRTALTFTLTGFVTLLLAYVGSRFVFEVVLHRGLT